MLGVSALAAVLQVAVLVLLARLHVLNPDYSITGHAVSDYGVGRTVGTFRIYLWLGNTAFLLFAWLFRTSSNPTFQGVTSIYLLLLVLARVGVIMFPADLEGRRLTRNGLVHYAFAVAGFALVYLTIDRATDTLVGSAGLIDSTAWTALRWIVVASLAAVVLTMAGPLRRIFGLAERAYIVSYCIWFFLLALQFAVASL